jgi:hypothetical protein
MKRWWNNGFHAIVVTRDAPSLGLKCKCGADLSTTAGIAAAIGEISRFKSPQKLVTYLGLNPRVGERPSYKAQKKTQARNEFIPRKPQRA